MIQKLCVENLHYSPYFSPDYSPYFSPDYSPYFSPNYSPHPREISIYRDFTAHTTEQSSGLTFLELMSIDVELGVARRGESVWRVVAAVIERVAVVAGRGIAVRGTRLSVDVLAEGGGGGCGGGGGAWRGRVPGGRVVVGPGGRAAEQAQLVVDAVGAGGGAGAVGGGGGGGGVEGLGGEVAEDAVDGGDARYVVLVADVLVEQSVADLPREYRRAFSLVVGYFVYNVRRGYSGLAPADRSWLYRARFVVAA